MERIIKFRGKLTGKALPLGLNKGDWWTGFYYEDLHCGEWKSFIKCGELDLEVDKDTVGQFTGLLDKNGKEIYEGDILRGDEYPYNCDGIDNYFVEIVWADNVCGFYRITHKKPNSTVSGISHGNWSELDEEDIKSFEVIGNIHDNPELLKGGAE